MKKQQKVKKVALPVLAVVFAAAALVVGFTVAHSRDRSVLANVFEIGDYQVQFVDTFQSPSNWITGQTVSKEIKVKNTTSTPVVARVQLAETWDSKDGAGLPLVGSQSNVRMAVVNYLENSGWQSDGTWWYSPVLQPGETSTSLITGVTLNEDANLSADWRYGGATYKLSAKAEVIQSELAATEWHKTAAITVCSMSRKAYALNGRVGGYFGIERATTKPSFTDNEEDHYIQIDEESNVPVYLWLENGDTIKWYSEADDIYLIENESCGPGYGFSTGSIYPTSLVGLRDLNTSRMTSMWGMFESSNQLASLDGLENWDVSNVTSFGKMFDSGGNGGVLSDISALARWDVSNVTDMEYMFSNNRIADVSALAGWNVGKVDHYLYMFLNNSIKESICSLADWPVKHNLTGYGSGMFFTSGSAYPTIDAHCLDGWNIDYDKASNWFNQAVFTIPSWAH